MVKNSGGVHI